MNKMQPHAVEQIALACSKAAAGCGIAASLWSWIGENHHQMSVIFGFICTIVAVAGLIKSFKE